MRELDTLIFDWDGTLANSIERIVTAMQVAAAELRLPALDGEQVRGIIGLGLPEAIAVLYPGLVGEPRAQELARGYSAHYRRLDSTPSPLFDGVLDVLERFRREGFQLAVATGKGRAGLERILAAHGLSHYFDATRCADETASKPDPRMLHEILQACDSMAGRALMVGDSEFDIQMAHNAGMPAVAVSYGAQSREQLALSRPAHCIDRFDELYGWVLAQRETLISNEVN